MPTRRLLCVAVFLLAATSTALGQITWNFTYSDDTNTTPANFGFADPTAVNSTTLGQLRKASATAATAYLNTVLDGRGTVALTWNNSVNQPASGTLASFGGNNFPNLGEGSFTNGGVYTAARAGATPFAGADGDGQVNFGRTDWHYDVAGTNTTLSGRIDLVSVLIHEIGHSLGYLSFANQSTTLNAESTFSEWNRNMVRGSTTPTAMFATDKTQTNYGSFLGPTATFTAGNAAANGLFFNGAYAREVFGAVVPLYAPNPFESGSSLSHVNDSNAIMNPSITAGVMRRFQAYEIAILMDLGWNNYNWNGTRSSSANTGNWSEGIGDYTSSRWTTDKGITLIANPGAFYNVNSSQGEAPILPIYGQVTANNVLNFNNSGTTSYTSTNNLGTVRLSRLNLNSTSSGATTIAGGTLNFGQNANGSASVLVPKIVQNGNGVVTISSAIQTNTVATQTVDGVSFTGHNGITVEGTGGGAVTLSGVISGTGGITKNSSTFNLTLAGANDYTGTTTVTAGGLYVNGSLSSTTNGVTVNGGTLGGTGTISRAITVNSTGTLEGGTSTTLGTLGVKAATTVNGGGNLRAELGSSTSDKLDMTGGSHTLTLRDGSFVALSANGFTRTSTTYTLADLNGSGLGFLTIGTTDVAADTTITTFTSTGANAGGSANGVGNVDFALSNFTAGNVLAGDTFVLRRNLGGDLVVVFTPVPEPAGILLLCGLVTVGGLAWRRWKPTASRAA